MKKILKLVIFFVAIIALLYACSKRWIENKFISTVKDDYFSEVNSSVTIEKMLDTMCTSSEWSFEPSEVNQYVVYNGTCNGEPLRLSFLVYNFGGEMRWKVSSMTYGGKSLPDPDDNAGFALYEEYLRHK